MAVSEEEKRILRAYNAGRILSMYEPKLLERIINANPQNAFVRTMAVAKEHHEFDVGIPKKENTIEFKNGFQNARALSEQDPALLDKMIGSQSLDKDFKRGLAAGKQEAKVRQTMTRMKQERAEQHRNVDRDMGMDY